MSHLAGIPKENYYKLYVCCSFWGVSRMGYAFIFLRWFKLAHILFK